MLRDISEGLAHGISRRRHLTEPGAVDLTPAVVNTCEQHAGTVRWMVHKGTVYSLSGRSEEQIEQVAAADRLWLLVRQLAEADGVAV